LTGRYAKRLTPSLALTLSGTFRHLTPDAGSTENGFGNLEFGAKYELLTSARHEAVVSLALDVELGGTGKREVGAASFSTISPALVFGKGFGDLPDALNAFKPLAITGSIGPNIPTRSKNVQTRMALDDGGGLEPEVESNSVNLSWGFSLQYQLSYLSELTGGPALASPLGWEVAPARPRGGHSDQQPERKKRQPYVGALMGRVQRQRSEEKRLRLVEASIIEAQHPQVVIGPGEARLQADRFEKGLPPLIAIACLQ
jgi:hypothetical protein